MARNYLTFEKWEELKSIYGSEAYKHTAIQCISGASMFKTPSSFFDNPNKAVDNCFRAWLVKGRIIMTASRNVILSAFICEDVCNHG